METKITITLLVISVLFDQENVDFITENFGKTFGRATKLT